MRAARHAYYEVMWQARRAHLSLWWWLDQRSSRGMHCARPQMASGPISTGPQSMRMQTNTHIRLGGRVMDCGVCICTISKWASTSHSIILYALWVIFCSFGFQTVYSVVYIVLNLVIILRIYKNKIQHFKCVILNPMILQQFNNKTFFKIYKVPSFMF